jgi:hypothetical protein
MKWCSAITTSALNSVRPVLNRSSATLACCVLFSCCRSNEVLRRTYGKDNRVLHTAKLSQGFKVVPPMRTWQGAGIFTGGTKIGVTGSETRTAKLRLGKVKQQQGEATIMSKQKSCGVVVACSLLVAFALAQGAKKVCLRKPQQTRAGNRTSDARMRHTKLTQPGFRQRIDPRHPEVFLSAA